MKRIVMSGFGALLIAAFVGVMGCEGGGVEPGMPKDTTPAVTPDVKISTDMNTSPKGPPATAPGDAPKTPEKK